MSRDFPMVSEFREDSPRCPATGWNGCAVAATEALLRRYRLGLVLPTQKKLGDSMGRRHRAMDGTSTHGICPSPWCPYCSYLELKGWHVPVGYGRISIAQLRDHARARHAVHLGGWYQAIHAVPPSSYSRDAPARGRSDTSLDGKFRHSIVVWEVGRARPDGEPATYIVSDPDFGSPRRPVMPPYCEYDAHDIEEFYRLGQMKMVYCLRSPQAFDDGAAAAHEGGAATLRFGGEPRGQGRYVTTPADGARQRSSPYIRTTNIIRTVPAGTEFRWAQSTLAGTNVHGSGLWRGDITGTVWMHDSVLKHPG
jgi:hypothetical protein